MIEAATHASWLRIIITSRPEVDIECFFDALHIWSWHLQYDLAAENDAIRDLRVFALKRFSDVASTLQESLLNRIISQADSLFIFIETVAHALDHCDDPTEYLEETLGDSAVAGLNSLYDLYSSILKA